MLVVFYRTEADCDQPTQQVCVYRQIDSKYAPVTTFTLTYKNIRSISIYEDDIYIATNDLVHKYTIKDNIIVGQKSLDVGPVFALHSYNGNVFIGGADSNVFITSSNFCEPSKYKIPQDEQISCIANAGNNFTVTFQTKISMFDYVDDKFTNVRQIEYPNYFDGIISYGRFIYEPLLLIVVKDSHTNVAVINEKKKVLQHTIQTPIDKAVISNNKEVAVSSDDATKIYIYTIPRFNKPLISVNVMNGVIIEINFLNDQFVRYTTADRKNIRYYSYNRINKITKLIDIKPMEDKIRMS
jgi:hypothetical protein